MTEVIPHRILANMPRRARAPRPPRPRSAEDNAIEQLVTAAHRDAQPRWVPALNPSQVHSMVRRLRRVTANLKLGLDVWANADPEAGDVGVAFRVREKRQRRVTQ